MTGLQPAGVFVFCLLTEHGSLEARASFDWVTMGGTGSAGQEECCYWPSGIERVHMPTAWGPFQGFGCKTGSSLHCESKKPFLGSHFGAPNLCVCDVQRPHFACMVTKEPPFFVVPEEDWPTFLISSACNSLRPRGTDPWVHFGNLSTSIC